MHGVGSIILSRNLAQHYGVQTPTPFQEGVHREADAFIDRFTGTKLTMDNVDWFAAKVG
jgi:hypothetical protein